MVRASDLALPQLVQKVGSVPYWIDFIPVEDTERDSYHNDPDAKSNKAHLLLFLNYRHISGKKQTLVSNRSKGGDSNQKAKEYKNYNRIVFFADCLNGGRVCTKILESPAASVSFFENMMHGQYGVGWLYVMEE